jgi:hypothetical protein
MENRGQNLTFLSFSQSDICASSRQIAQTLVMAGLLIVVGHDLFSLLLIGPLGLMVRPGGVWRSRWWLTRLV